MSISEPSIIFEDEQLLILNKPAGVTVTEGPGHPHENTTAGWILRYIGEPIVGVGQEGRWGIIHRLDKETSGILVVVKTQPMYDHLRTQFQSRDIAKEYTTLVWGDVQATVAQKLRKQVGKKGTPEVEQQRFTINAPIARHPKGISRFIVNHEGKPAQTNFQIKQTFSFTIDQESYPATLLTAFPKTGRTHQIRVHLKAFGHPVIGDGTYQTHAQRALAQPFCPRQFLHASAISFEGIDGETLHFEAPLPEDLQKVLEVVGESVTSSV